MFVSRFVVVLATVMSVPSAFVFIAGFAGVQPVESCSFIIVFWVVAAHPLLCMVSADSNTPSTAVTFGVSLVISSIGVLFACCMVLLISLVLFRLFGYVKFIIGFTLMFLVMLLSDVMLNVVV